MIGSLDWKLLLPILLLLYIVLLLPVTINTSLNELHIVNILHILHQCLLPCAVKICLQLILLSQGKFFLMIGTLGVLHELIFTISVSFKLVYLTQFNLDLI